MSLHSAVLLLMLALVSASEGAFEGTLFFGVPNIRFIFAGLFVNNIQLIKILCTRRSDSTYY